MNGLDLDAVRKEMEAVTDTSQLLEAALKQAEHDPEGMRKDIRLLDPTSVDTTRAITLKLGKHEFKPLIAYAIYTADYIRGYKDPKLVIEFDEVSLLPFVHFEAEEKVNAKAPDAVDLLKEFMPKETVYEDRARWTLECEKERAKIEQGPLSLNPVFSLNADYDVRLLRFSDTRSSQYLNRLFFFCWMFIEGAQAPDEADQTWEVYVLTHKDSNAFVGYSSVYSFFYYQNGEKFEAEAALQLPTRKRIAHFLILPPYQGAGIGKKFYTDLVKHFVGDNNVKEIEVEEPSAGFEVLRDRAHYEWLTEEPEAKTLLEDYEDDSEVIIAKLMEKYKLEKVQLQRVAEMFIFMSNGQKESRAIKRLIKSRLWARNYGDLRDMDPATQREQLHNVYESALHMHKVALHLEEPSEEEEEEDDDEVDPSSNPAEMLLAQLTQGMASGSVGPPADKKQRTM